MGGLTSAVHWWEEWQLRVLVLTSLAIQFFLFCFPFLRVRALRGWVRFIMWLAYHAGDAVAIYALAMLFNRHKDQADGGVGGGRSSNTLLEVVWAPVLLIHLGGPDGVTAYNIEDNELWSRHLLIAVSQITVAVYVFCKSWPPGGDTRLLQAAILLFIVGVVKCLVKARAFKRASIYSLVSSVTEAKLMNDGYSTMSLEEYVEDVRDVVVEQQQPEDHHQGFEEEEDRAAEGSSNYPRLIEDDGDTYKLFVDHSSIYPRRSTIFSKFWGLSEERAYHYVQEGLAIAFFLLYTKLKIAIREDNYKYMKYEPGSWGDMSPFIILNLRMLPPWASIALFHYSDREAYNGIDVKVTYAILCCTAVLETFSTFVLIVMAADLDGPEVWPETVAQYSLAGYFVRNKKHSKKIWIASFLQCKDFLDQHWCMEPCFSSARITHLVLRYLKDGWKQKIQDAASYRSFNNHSSHWGLNMNRPFDECVLLWHLVTDFCFFSSRPQCSQESAECKAVQCRQMSNYMVYLLFVNPEMLLPGSRRNIFKTAYGELKDILRDWNWKPACWSRCTPCVGLKLMEEEEATVMGRLITVMQQKSEKRPSQEESSKEAIVTDTVITVTRLKSERSSQEESSTEGSNKDENLIDQAWALAQRLSTDEMKMWEEIQDVWVQMLCFSASRCRGYLHAKALGKGGEFLSYVWLLLFYMGMETFSERLQRELFPIFQENFHNSTAPPPTSEVSTIGAGASTASEVHTHAGAGTTPSTSEIRMAEDNMG